MNLNKERHEFCYVNRLSNISTVIYLARFKCQVVFFSVAFIEPATKLVTHSYLI